MYGRSSRRFIDTTHHVSSSQYEHPSPCTLDRAYQSMRASVQMWPPNASVYRRFRRSSSAPEKRTSSLCSCGAVSCGRFRRSVDVFEGTDFDQKESIASRMSCVALHSTRLRPLSDRDGVALAAQLKRPGWRAIGVASHHWPGMLRTSVPNFPARKTWTSHLARASQSFVIP